MTLYLKAKTSQALLSKTQGVGFRKRFFVDRGECDFICNLIFLT